MAEGKKAWTSTRKASNAGADAGRKARKQARKAAQDLAAKRNKDADYTPWDIQKEKRFKARLGKKRAEA